MNADADAGAEQADRVNADGVESAAAILMR